jgi:hypothetical protein
MPDSVRGDNGASLTLASTDRTFESALSLFDALLQHGDRDVMSTSKCAPCTALYLRFTIELVITGECLFALRIGAFELVK